MADAVHLRPGLVVRSGESDSARMLRGVLVLVAVSVVMLVWWLA